MKRAAITYCFILMLCGRILPRRRQTVTTGIKHRFRFISSLDSCRYDTP